MFQSLLGNEWQMTINGIQKLKSKLDAFSTGINTYVQVFVNVGNPAKK